MFGIGKKQKNRRAGRVHVLDVKLRSEQLRKARIRFAALAFGFVFGTIFGFYVIWRLGEWTLNALVYENSAFAIQQMDVRTDGVISTDQLRRWAGVKAGQNLLALNLLDVRRNLEMVPGIASASVERVLPRTLLIRVAERVPVAKVNFPRAKPSGGIEVIVFQLDAEGWVMEPLDPRQRTVPLSQATADLPILTGLSTTDLQSGRRVDTPQVQTALKLITAFDCSEMAGLVDLRKIDVSSPSVVTITTEQGSEVTFSLQNLDPQLKRWRSIHERGQTLNKAIAWLDLAVTNNTPVRWIEAAAIPPVAPAPKPQRTQRTPRNHV